MHASSFFGIRDYERYKNVCAKIDLWVRQGRLIAHPYRAKIICLAAMRASMSIGELATLLETSLSVVLYHARLLENAGYLKIEKDGRYSRVSVTSLARQLVPYDEIENISYGRESKNAP